VQGRVHLLGARDDALQYVRAFNAFVMPSLSEGLPLALLEGMSGHLPVLGSDIDSLRPILEDCGGQMFKSRNVESLAKELSRLLQMSEKERQSKGEQAYSYLCANHNINDFRRQYRDLLEEFLASGQCS
jgi:glycosyltransferase involved in cell wall biosynthesis